MLRVGEDGWTHALLTKVKAAAHAAAALAEGAGSACGQSKRKRSCFRVQIEIVPLSFGATSSSQDAKKPASMPATPGRQILVRMGVLRVPRQTTGDHTMSGKCNEMRGTVPNSEEL